MSKFTPVAIILGGAGGLAGSYHVAPKHNNKSVSPKINVLFKDKYKNPLLDLKGDEKIWDSKWNLLKAGKPVHPKLKKL